MINLLLVKPDIKFKKSYQEALLEMEDASDRAAWVYLGDSADTSIPLQDFDFYIQTLLDRETKPPENFVCDTIYWAIVAGEVVGRIAIRHELNDFLAKVGGHIGYIVRPSYRRRGIATLMLREILKGTVAKRIGKLLLTCTEGNIPSEKTIIKNGGKFESVFEHPQSGAKKKRFWIDLSSVESR